MKQKINWKGSSRIPGWLGAAVGLGLGGVYLYRRRKAREWRARQREQLNLSGGKRPVALVTGASAGIGRVYALRLAQMGYRLVLAARRVERLEALAEEIRSRWGAAVEVLPADLSTQEGIARVEQRAEKGDIAFLVNNAGYGVFGEFAHTPLEQILGQIECLDLAAVRLTHAVLRGMLERRRGVIVNVSSIGAFIPKAMDVIYVAAKAFINQFTESLALELRGSGVRVQALCPGMTRTEFHDHAQYAQFNLKERLPGWVWMEAEDVVAASLAALAEDHVICVPGLLNQLMVTAARLGLVQALMGVAGGLVPGIGRVSKPEPN